ncbi:N-acetylmuramoyl-L-alanine amidase [Promicromonospora vindobonensis]|uniref:N-acetylmuramoyl-L-alanine amidase n=1 Tax=Promicromonospora vindobonensis TaxID=195748 RepID=A0ABW5VLQ3_9MICO
MIIPIATRKRWGPRYPDGDLTLTGPADEVFVHHSVTAQLSPDASVEDECEQMRALESVGQSRFGTGISYNVVIFPSGRAYQGVSWNRRGTHTGGRNSTARSICFAGNYEIHEPTAAQLATAAVIYAEGKGHLWVLSAPLRGHRDVSQTACPGRHLYAELPAIRAGRTLTKAGGFMSDLTKTEQKEILHDGRQTVEKLERIEETLKAQRENDLKHMSASAARERALLETVKVLAANGSVNPDEVLKRLDALFENLTITISKEG